MDTSPEVRMQNSVTSTPVPLTLYPGKDSWQPVSTVTNFVQAITFDLHPHGPKTIDAQPGRVQACIFAQAELWKGDKESKIQEEVIIR